MAGIVHKLWSAMKKFLRSLLIAYLVVIVLLAFLQRKLIYHPEIAREIPVGDFRDITSMYPGATDVRIRSVGDLEIGGWLLSRSSAGGQLNGIRLRPLVLYLHGNAGNRAGRGGWYALLHSVDVDVLTIDYHGYGDSAGAPSEQSLYSCVQAAWDYAVEELKYDPSQIVIMGVSLGGATAVHLAAETCTNGRAPAGLITVATFNSMTEVARSHYPWLPVRSILVDRYPSDQKIPLVTCPILQMHGDQDDIVDESFGLALFEAAPQRSASGVDKRWLGLERTGHNDMLSVQGALVAREIAAFIGQVTGR